MGQQQFPMQQQGQMQAANPAASPAPFPSSPYVMNQDPYAAAAAAPMGTIMPGTYMCYVAWTFKRMNKISTCFKPYVNLIICMFKKLMINMQSCLVYRFSPIP